MKNTDILKTLTHAQRIEKLKQERQEILRLSPEKALETILNSPHMLPLVHSFPEQDFYFLMHDIGPEDFMPVLATASARQWEYILDLEVWEDDRISLGAVTYWLGLLAKADTDRFLKWILNEKLIFVEYYLFNNIELRIREHDEDPSDFGDGFFTLDNVFYVRFKDVARKASEESLPTDVNEEKGALLATLLSGMAAIDHTNFQKVLLESTAILPAEFEAEAFRLRNARLEEKGFLSFEESLGLYYPIKPADLEKAAGGKYRYMAAGLSRTEPVVVPMVPMGLLEENHIFAKALDWVDNDELLVALQIEFVSLCNRLIVADRKIIREKKSLGEIVRKACGFINLGLQALDESSDSLSIPPLNRIAGLICKVPLVHIFRAGYGLAADLKQRANQWVQASWFRSCGLALSFWDEKWMGMLGGLLIKRPLYFDHFRTNVMYREFADISEIRAVEKELHKMMAFDHLFERMRIDVSCFAGDWLTYKNLLLTLWAKECIAQTDDGGTLTFEEFRLFFKLLFPDSEQIPHPATPIRSEMKSALMDWLSLKTGQSRLTLSRLLAPALEELFNELQDEYGRVAFRDLDPKFIFHFCIKG